MADQVSNPETEPQADSNGVGSDTSGTPLAAEDAPMDPAADIEQLDDSLSAMTDLLLSSSADDEFDL